MNIDMLSTESNRRFQQARRRVMFNQWMNIVKGKTDKLLSFEEVRKTLNLRQSRNLGLRSINLDKIVGSVGRHKDFTSDFLPRFDSKLMEGRWRKLYDLANGLQGFPPINLFKVGSAYFVEDGHHRLSVARMNEAKTIEAYVTDYDVPSDVTTFDGLGERLNEADQPKSVARPRLRQHYLLG